MNQLILKLLTYKYTMYYLVAAVASVINIERVWFPIGHVEVM